MVRISENQYSKLEKIVKYHNSDQAKILLRGLYLLDKLNLELRDYEDNGIKNKRIGIRLNEDEINLIKKLEDKFETKFTNLLRYSIELQYKTIDKLEKTEKDFLLRD